MNRLGKLDDLGLGMGLSMHPAQKINAKHASLDGLAGEAPSFMTIFTVVGLVYLGYFWFLSRGTR